MEENIENVKKLDRKMVAKFPVYLIHSPLSMEEIKIILEKMKGRVSLIRVEMFKGNETDRTIVIMDHSVHENLIELGYGRFSYPKLNSVPYILRKRNYPRENESLSLFIPLPNNLPSSECRLQIKRKLDEIVKFGIINEDDFSIIIPYQSRIAGKHNGMCFIKFKDEVDKDSRAIIKVLLNDSFWIFKNKIKLASCFWVRNRKKFPKIPNKKNNVKENQ